MERSADLVAGLLASLKAGAVHVVLDPAQPPSRLALTLRDAAPAVVLTHGATRALPACGAPVIDLESAGEAIARESAENLGLPVLAGQLAYGIYTSGSTGAPKGILIRQDAVVNLLRRRYRVASAICNPPTYEGHAWIRARTRGQRLPLSEELGARLFCPTIHPLMTDGQNEYIAAAVIEAMDRVGRGLA